MKSHIPTLLGSCKKCFDVCQISGFYCPLGSPTPVPCPKGTYGPTADAMSIHSCLNCPPHHYCPRPGLPAILPCGPGAQQHLSGQDTCICKGEGQSFQVSKLFFFQDSSHSCSMCVPSGVFMWLCIPRFHINTSTSYCHPLAYLSCKLPLCSINPKKNTNFSSVWFFCVSLESLDTLWTLIWE